MKKRTKKIYVENCHGEREKKERRRTEPSRGILHARNNVQERKNGEKWKREQEKTTESVDENNQK